MSNALLPLMEHLPTPGDHYSPATGSAVITVLHGLVREHVAAGGSARIIVTAGTYADRYPEGNVVECAAGPALPGRRARAAEALTAYVTGRRPWSAAPWAPSVATLIGSGLTFVHNGVSAGPLLPTRSRRVLYMHNTLLRTYSRREARLALSRFDDVITVSAFLAAEVRDRAGESVPIHVVHNGVDTTTFRPGPGPGRPTIMFLGRILPGKGVMELVEAATRIRDRDFALRIIGRRGFTNDEPLSDFELALRRAAAPLGDRVSFEPFIARDHVPDVLRQASVLVQPSTAPEGLPLGLLEGMASGVACVASDAGGIPEVLHGAGLVTPKGDVGALADALALLLDDDAARAHAATACRARAEGLTWQDTYAALSQALHS